MKYKLELTENQIRELEINVQLRVDELDYLVEESQEAVEWQRLDTENPDTEHLEMRKAEQRAMKQVLKKIHKNYTTQGDE